MYISKTQEEEILNAGRASAKTPGKSSLRCLGNNEKAGESSAE